MVDLRIRFAPDPASVPHVTVHLRVPEASYESLLGDAA